MIATQKLKRSTAVSSIQDSKCKEMREWIFLANSSVYNMENTVVLQQIVCFGRKDVSLKFDFYLIMCKNKTKLQKILKTKRLDQSVSVKEAIF